MLMNLRGKIIVFLFCFGRQRNKIISTPSHKLIITPYILLWELFLSSTHFLKTHLSEFINPDCRKTLSFLIDRWYRNVRDPHYMYLTKFITRMQPQYMYSIWLTKGRKKVSSKTSKEKNPKFSVSSEAGLVYKFTTST